MWRKLIETSDELAAWLEERHRFEDCHLLGLHSDDADGQPKTITFELGQPEGGSYDANAELTLRVYRFTASGLAVWRLPEQPNFGIDWTLESVEPEAADKGVRIWVDEDFMVHCARLEVTRLPDRTEIVPAEVSDRNFYATTENQPLPTPAEWVGWFRQHGEKVAWRMYGEPARPLEQVPESDYEGWFLQREDAVADTLKGLFFFHCRARGSGLFLSVERDQAAEGLWTAMQRIIGGFPGVEVETGNCRFTGPEWLDHLK